MPVRDIADIRADPHLQAVNFFVRREHPTEGAYFDMKAPVRFGAVPGSLAAHAQTIGQDTEAVRRDGWIGAP
jgi:crotonobetainyl-CoA:carnitine CoA-transferase CaiB-like acyl-CoA transferase